MSEGKTYAEDEDVNQYVLTWILNKQYLKTTRIRGGTQKFPELLKKIYLKYLYKFETLVPFEVLPLRLNAAIPAPLPVLALDSISGEDFRQCFQHWERCWDCCIHSQGEYFEGD